MDLKKFEMLLDVITHEINRYKPVPMGTHELIWTETEMKVRKISLNNPPARRIAKLSADDINKGLENHHWDEIIGNIREMDEQGVFKCLD